jgi:hypothetical protein
LLDRSPIQRYPLFSSVEIGIESRVKVAAGSPGVSGKPRSYVFQRAGPARYP